MALIPLTFKPECWKVSGFFFLLFSTNQAQKFQQGLEEAKKENQQTKEKFMEAKNQLTQNQNQLTQVP